MIPSLGILGLGNRSTLFYLDRINTLYNDKNGGYTTCPYLLLNTNFDDINPFLPDQFLSLTPVLENYVQQLIELGVKKILIPNITIHECLNKSLFFNKKALFIHPLEILKKALQKTSKVKSVVVLGTRYTMNNKYFQDQIENRGLLLGNIGIDNFDLVDKFRTAIYLKNETDNLKIQFDTLIHELKEKHTIVIACTELSVYFQKTDPNIINLPILQIEAAISEKI